MIGNGKPNSYTKVEDEAARLALATPYYGLVYQIDTDELYAWSTISNAWIIIGSSSVGYPSVNTFADLPAAAVGNAGEIYVVLTASGLWPFTRKPAGMYYSDGVSWAYMSAYPDLMKDTNFGIQNGTDGTKVVKFDVSSILTGTIRTITVPDADCTLLTGIAQSIAGIKTYTDTTQSNNTITGGVSTLTGAAIFDGGVSIRKNLRVLGGVLTNIFFAGIPQYQLTRINGTTEVASKVLSGDVVGQLSFNGYTDTLNSVDTGAYIRAIATGNYDSGTNKPTDLIFATASATGIATEALRITSLQRVGIGFTDPAVPLEATTAIRISRIASNAILQINRINGTRDVRTGVLSGDIIGDINFTGSYDATTNVTTGAVIQAIATNNWSNTVRSTDLAIKTASSSGTVAEIARFTGIGGNFGLGVSTDIQARLHINAGSASNPTLSNPTGSAIIIQQGSVLAAVMGLDSNASFYIQGQRINSGGNNTYEVHLNPLGGNVFHGGFTRLGDTTANGCPAVKMKKLTGTTASAEGGVVEVTHGVTASKIIGVSCKVVSSTDYGIAPEYTNLTGYQYNLYHNATVFSVSNHPTNSENILSKPITITIFYEE